MLGGKHTWKWKGHRNSQLTELSSNIVQQPAFNSSSEHETAGNYQCMIVLQN